MSFKDLSRELSKNGFFASPKTIERWIKFLKKDYQFSEDKSKDLGSFSALQYFPTFFYEKLGIITVLMVLHEPKKVLFDGYPFNKYHDFASWIYDTKTMKNVLFYIFEVPIEFFDLFKKEWMWIKKRGVVKNYELYATHKAFNFYSPWHKTIDKNGIFHPEKNEISEIDLQLNKFDDYLKNLPEFKMDSIVKKNPLIIPIIFEQNRTGWSSVKIWNTMKNKMGKSAWEYISKEPKVKSDNVAIKKIQKGFKQLNESKILHQMKVSYMPLEHKNNFWVYLIVEGENKDIIMDTIRKIASSSIYSSFRPVHGNKNCFFVMAIMNGQSLPFLLNSLEKTRRSKIFFFQHERFLSLVKNKDICKFNYKHSFSAPARKWKL